MTSDGERGLRADVADNYLRTLELLQRHRGGASAGHRTFGRVEALHLEHEVAFYNAVLAFDPRATLDEVRAAVGWIRSLGLEPSVHALDGHEGLGEALTELGLGDEERSPAMALRPIPPTLEAPIPAAAVVRTGGIELAEAWYTALEASERFRATFTPEVIADADARVAVVDLDAVPVAAAMAVRSDHGVLGVYVVWTAEHARRMGLGRAATWAAIRAGADAWDSRTAVLQASEMGAPLYAGMGFTEVGIASVFTRSGDAPASPDATR